MTDRDSGPAGEPAPELDPEEQRVASLLADLADDPDAPPSTVSAASVLAAVRAQASADDSAGPVPAPGVSTPGVSTPGVSTPGVSTPGVSTPGVSARSDGSVVDGRHRFQGRRRAVLVGVLAAACLAAVAAVVIPLSLRSSETATSAESALDTAGDSTVVAGQGAPAPGQSAAGSAAGSAVVQPPDAAGESAASSAGCAWPPLSADELTALTLSLPPGRFGAPGELVSACAAEPVAGARLPDSTGGSLVVTVVTAKPGACANGSSNVDATEAGIRCVSQGSGRYLSTDAAGAQTAYAYADGLEVAVGKDQSGTGLPEGAPLTADQLLAVAQAVMAALG